jgi:hypothetical protein
MLYIIVRRRNLCGQARFCSQTLRASEPKSSEEDVMARILASMTPCAFILLATAPIRQSADNAARSDEAIDGREHMRRFADVPSECIIKELPNRFGAW